MKKLMNQPKWVYAILYLACLSLTRRYIPVIYNFLTKISDFCLLIVVGYLLYKLATYLYQRYYQK